MAELLNFSSSSPAEDGEPMLSAFIQDEGAYCQVWVERQRDNDGDEELHIVLDDMAAGYIPLKTIAAGVARMWELWVEFLLTDRVLSDQSL